MNLISQIPATITDDCQVEEKWWDVLNSCGCRGSPLTADLKEICVKRWKEKVTLSETMSGLKQQALQELRRVGRNEDRQVTLKSLFDLNIHQ